MVVASESDYKPCGDMSRSLMDMHWILSLVCTRKCRVYHSDDDILASGSSKLNPIAAPV